jgi:hypothetical protein
MNMDVIYYKILDGVFFGAMSSMKRTFHKTGATKLVMGVILACAAGETRNW